MLQWPPSQGGHFSFACCMLIKRKTPRLEVWGFHRVGNIDRFLKPMCMAVDVSLLDLGFSGYGFNPSLGVTAKPTTK